MYKSPAQMRGFSFNNIFTNRSSSFGHFTDLNNVRSNDGGANVAESAIKQYQITEFTPSCPSNLKKLHVIIDDGRAWYPLEEIMCGLTLIDLRDTLDRLDPEAVSQIGNIWYINDTWLNTAMSLARNPKAYNFNSWLLKEVKPMVQKILANPSTVATTSPINKVADVMKKFGIGTTRFYKALKKNNLTTEDLRDKSGNFTDAGLAKLESIFHSEPKPITDAFKDGHALPQIVSENPVLEFASEQFGKVRVLERDGEPWFVAKDMAEILLYKNPQEAIRDHVDPEDKGVSEILTPGGKQKLPIINESGFYSLVIRSKLPAAKAFKRWVTHDVLPSIRKRGMYATPMTARQMLESPDFARTVLEALISEQEKNVALQQKIAADAPKVLFSDTVEDRGQNVGLGTFAKMLYNDETQIGRQKLIRWLRSKNYFIQNAPIPYQEYINKGWFLVKTKIINTGEAVPVTLITPKGQIALTTAYKQSY